MSDSSKASTAGLWQPGKHIPQLDGVRGWAIVIVTLYRFSKEMPTDTWYGQALHALFCLGDRGVDLFFVLSGFLITGILIDSQGSQGYFANFLARRSLRIFPLYFVSLLLCLVVTPAIPAYRGLFAQAEQQQVYLWSYLTNIKMSLEGHWCFGYLDHFWSLAVEEHFYLVWPAVLCCCTRSTALRLAGGLALLAATSRIAFAAFSANGVAPDVLTLFRCDALLIGGVLALAIRRPGGLAPITPWARWLLPAALAAGLAAAFGEKRLWTIPHTLWPVIWACLLIILLQARPEHLVARFFNAPGLRKLGTLSYAMYVFQSPLIPVIGLVMTADQCAAWAGNAVLGTLIYMGLMFGLTYAAALLSWHCLESHCLKLKRWFPSHPQSSAPLRRVLFNA